MLQYALYSVPALSIAVVLGINFVAAHIPNSNL